MTDEEQANRTSYIVITGDDEPELIGPFESEEEASNWGRDNLGFETFWTTDISRATSPYHTAFVAEEELS